MTQRPLSPTCLQFHQNPDINPITKSPMELESRSYLNFVRECGPPPTTNILQVQQNQPTPQVNNNNYYPQDQPQANEFKFTATPENTHYIQATIETARILYPSLELHIQAAETANILGNERRRSNFASYMRDASL